MIGFSVFLCKEKIAIIKRKREKGACKFEQQYTRGKEKDRERNKEADLHSSIYLAGDRLPSLSVYKGK